LFFFSRARSTPQDAAQNCFLAVTAAFLFGYQMHEKTVLLPLVIFSLAYPKRPTEVLCITISAMLSMYDLLQRDGHVSTYTASMLLLSAAALSTRPSSFSERCVTAATICAVVLYHTAQALLPPPAKYPWFYPYLAASLCCARQAPTPPFHNKRPYLVRSLSWSIVSSYWGAICRPPASAARRKSE
jgi:hypothetical protein